MGREFELKYRADAAQIGAIREKFGEFAAISMETVYYDTPDMKLAFHHRTLRRRMENGVSVCTFKQSMEDGSRAEWEVEADAIMPGVMKLCQQGAPAELMRATAGGLQQLCGARFTRLAKTIALENCTLELALDQGVLLAGGRESSLCEVEVELKNGTDALAVAFARALAEEFGLVPEPKSKFSRALALVFGG